MTTEPEHHTVLTSDELATIQAAIIALRTDIRQWVRLEELPVESRVPTPGAFNASRDLLEVSDQALALTYKAWNRMRVSTAHDKLALAARDQN